MSLSFKADDNLILGKFSTFKSWILDTLKMRLYAFVIPDSILCLFHRNGFDFNQHPER